ncbi:MAG: hypothetical protein KGZ65_06225 [Sphingomonadales bacterium]|nr:hypothetical protein [Sphingomonadaceae bacterium]MBS3930816.1 hypothetical protein [Sphingomonadales bacterium]
MRYLVAAIAVLALAPSSAGAVELVNPDGSRAEPYQTWANSARVPLPAGRFVVHRDTSICGYAVDPSGCAHPDGWIAIARDTYPMEPRHTFLHELGHHFIFQGPEWKRAWFKTVFPDTYGDERFANVYAECAVSPYRPRPATSAYKSRSFYRRLCRIIAA